MAAGDLSLVIAIGATDAASGVISALGSTLGKLAESGPLGAVAAAGVVAGAAIIGFGVSSVKAAGDFQQGMTMLSTSAGESSKNLGMVGDGIKKIAVDTGTSTEQLTKAMYQVESSGSHGADGLKILGVAAQGAKTENADLTVVAKALTTLLTDYHMGADKATSGMNGLIKAVSNGKTTLQELSGAMGQVLPVAASMHISFPQVAGAISTLTNAGVPAQQAAQNLAHVLVALNAPSGVAVKSMKAVGLSAQEVKDTLANQGLPQALQLIEDHVGKKFPAGSVEGVTALKNILGGLVGFKLAAALTGDSLKAFQANVDSTAAAMNSAGKDVAGFDLVQQNLNFQIDRAKAAFEVLQITIGQKLLPIVTPLIKGFVDLLSTLNNVISGTETSGKAMSEFGKVLGGLASVFAPIVSVIKILFIPALIALGTVFVLLAAVQIPKMILSILTFGEKMAMTALEVVNDTKEMLAGFGAMSAGLIESMAAATVAVVEVIGPFVLIALAIAALVVAFKLMYDHIKPIHDLMNAIAKVATDVAMAIGGALKAAFESVTGVIGKVVGAIAPLIEAFSKSKEAMNLLIAALIGLSVAILASVMPAIVAFLATIPGIVAGFVAWAAAAVTAAVATLAAAAPFIIIGLAVAAAIFVILELITHWGEISAWLKDKWDAFSKWFQTFWASVVKWVQDAWKNVVKFAEGAWKGVTDAWGAAGQWFQNLWKTIEKAAKDVWDWIVNAAKQGWKDIVGAVQAGVQAVVGFFKWLYDHNYYFKDLVDFAKKVWTDFIAWAKQAWSDVSTWFVEKWKWLSDQAKTIWKGITDNLKQQNDDYIKSSTKQHQEFMDWLTGAWKNVSGKAQEIWKGTYSNLKQQNDDYIKSSTKEHQEFMDWLKNLWDSMSKWAEKAWGAVGNVFSQAWSQHIQPALGGFGQKWNDFWGGVVTNAKEIGTNIIKAIADGFMGGVNYLSNAVHNALSFSLGALGFHGIPGFAGGVENFAGGWAVVGERGPELVFLPSGSSVIPSGSPPPVAMSGSAGGSSSSSSSRGGVMVINMILDGRQIGKAATTYQEGELRVAGNLRSR